MLDHFWFLRPLPFLLSKRKNQGRQDNLLTIQINDEKENTMKAIVQRVLKAKVVSQETQKENEIAKGYVVLIGISEDDTEKDVQKMSHKIVNLRIMPDNDGKMNLSLSQTEGELLLISQFTLISDNSHGFRPSFIKAMKPESAKPLFDLLVSHCQNSIPTKTGFFGDYMEVQLINDGPTTIILDSKLI